MKKMISISVSFCLMTAVVLAQSPLAFKYQAVARTNNGNLIQNQLVAFRITLLQGGPSGTLVYQERHTTYTNNYGLANLDIGKGTVLAGSFGLIDWSAGSMFIKVEFDPLGGTVYQNMGTSELLSVPYSKYSTIAENLKLPYYDTLSPYVGFLLNLVSTNSSCIRGEGTIGIIGYTNSDAGWGEGVFGGTNQTEGDYYGVVGATNSINGRGIYGFAYQTTGNTVGVYGETRSSSGIGVRGISLATSGINYGVLSTVASSSGYAGYFNGGMFSVMSTKVGLGNMFPQCQLDITSPGNTDVFRINHSSSTDYLFRFREAANGSGAFYIYDEAVNNTIFLYGNGNSFINSGNLGIGTSTPSYKLDVGGTVNLNKGITSAVALRVNGDEALWYNGTYFSWGYAGTYNFFGNKLKIAGNGNTAPSYELQVDGNAAKSSGGSTWIVSSDLRLKNVLGNYNKGLNEIMALQPVRFSYKAGNSRGLPSEVEQVGFVAQEVQKVFPEAVHESEDGLLDFNMHPVNVALVNAIKELKAENDRLKAENEKMNARLDKIEGSLNFRAEK
jgi:hypothetical protein